MPLTTAQKEWTIWLFDDPAVLDRMEQPGQGASTSATFAPGAAGDPGTAAVTSLDAPADTRLAALYTQLDLQAPGHQLSSGDSCWSPKVALLGAWTSVIAAGAGTIALVLAPEPTTLTKWAALATAAALVGALVGLAAAYGAVADCEQAASDAAERQREIDDLRRQQRAIQDTVEQLRREIQGR